jgi:hypothetical protein
MTFNMMVLILVSAIAFPTSSAWVHTARTSPLITTATTSKYSDLRFSSRVSGFGGQVVLLGPSSTDDNNNNLLQMKKGKSSVPPMMRKQYERQKEMMEMRRQMIENSKPGPDGLPIFNLFVRSKRVKVCINANW